MEVSFAELWNAIGGNTRHTHDSLVKMLSECHDLKEDFFINQGQLRYVVTLDTIDEYFKANQKPAKQLSKDEELKKLRAENANLKLQLQAFSVSPHVPPRPAPVVKPIEYTLAPPADPNIPDAPLANAPFPTAPPAEDEVDADPKSGIEVDPASLPRTKMSEAQIQADLRQLLKKEKPIDVRSIDARPRTRSPRAPE